MRKHSLLIAFVCIGLAAPFAQARDASQKKKQSAPEDEAAKKQLADEIANIKQGLGEAKDTLSKQHQRLVTVRQEPADQSGNNAKVAIIYRNEMSPLFTPVKYEVNVDGQNVFLKTDPLAFGPGQKEVEIYRGNLGEGAHEVSVVLTLKGSGYGAFSYLKDYKFIGRAGHVFNVKENKLTQVKIISGEKAASAPKDRPTIEFQDTNWNVNVPSAGAEQ